MENIEGPTPAVAPKTADPKDVTWGCIYVWSIYGLYMVGIWIIMIYGNTWYKVYLIGGFTPLKNMPSSVGVMKFSIEWNNKNVPKHQPDSAWWFMMIHDDSWVQMNVYRPAHFSGMLWNNHDHMIDRSDWTTFIWNVKDWGRQDCNDLWWTPTHGLSLLDGRKLRHIGMVALCGYGIGLTTFTLRLYSLHYWKFRFFVFFLSNQSVDGCHVYSNSNGSWYS